MPVTITINDDNSQALAFIEYLKTLDFVSFKEDISSESYEFQEEELLLSQETLEAIEKGLEDVEQGRLVPHQRVITKARDIIESYKEKWKGEKA